MCALHATVTDFLFELVRPATRNIFAREMHNRIELEEFLRIERLPGSPLQFAGSRRVTNQSYRRVTLLHQAITKRATN